MVGSAPREAGAVTAGGLASPVWDLSKGPAARSWAVSLVSGDARRGGTDVYPWLAGIPIFPGIFDWTFETRRRGLADFVTLNGSDQGDLRNATCAAAPDGATARVTRSLAGAVTRPKESRRAAEGGGASGGSGPAGRGSGPGRPGSARGRAG